LDFHQVEQLLIEMKQACLLPGVVLDQGLKSYNKDKANHLMKIF